MKKVILVTGGAGFLGSHLCERLLAGGHEVICVDNFQTGNKSNIEPLYEAGRRFEVLRHDIRQPLAVEVDEIYNLACPASPVHYQHDPVRTIETSIQGTTNLLSLARRTNAKLLQASTSEVYGDPEVHPQPESYRGSVNPIGPRACYDESKRCAETLCFEYQRQYGVRIKVPRIFNTYGPKMSRIDGRVVSNFIVQALLGEDITVYGSGKQTRSFCYVDDLISGLMAFMASGDQVAGPLNLGNPSEYTILEIAELVVELTKSTSRIVFRELPEDDPTRRQPVIERAKRELGWEPKVSLRDGLERTIDYFDNVLRFEQLSTLERVESAERQHQRKSENRAEKQHRNQPVRRAV